ncbi:MAG: ATP adenylyltransferase [Synechococcus lacustris]
MSSLAQRSLACQQRALAEGALVPLATELLDSSPWHPFQVRRLLSATPKHLHAPGPKPNPFQPWDRRLEVFGLDRHVVLLNKYPVEPGHLLLITRDWQHQGGWLNRDDWGAVAALWGQQSGLWFFNSGPEAGASQPHRHLQLLPRRPGQQPCPLAGQFLQALESGVTPWPWQLGLRPLDPSQPPSAETLAAIYGELAGAQGLGSPRLDASPQRPYNLLITPSWFALVPRRLEGHGGFSLNALAYGGYLLATENSDVAWLAQQGPLALLAEAALPRP